MLVLLSFNSYETSAFTPPSGSPLANREHPRLWLTASNISAIKAKLSCPSGYFCNEFRAFIRDLDNRITEPENWFGGWENDIQSYAFLCNIGPVSGVTYGNSVTTYCNRAKLMLSRLPVSDDITPFLNGALAYDWLYNVLTPTERVNAVNILKQTPSGYEGSFGNPFESNTIRTHVAHLVAGLAFWGDGIDDTKANTMVDMHSRLLDGTDGYLGAGSFISGTDGGWSQGLAYSIGSGTGRFVIGGAEAWRTANGYTKDQIYGASFSNVLRHYPQWLLYHLPGHGVPCGNCPGGFEYIAYRDHATDSVPVLRDLDIANYIGLFRVFNGVDNNVAGLAQWLVDQRSGRPYITDGYGQSWATITFALTEGGITPRSPTELNLPLTKYFKGLGWVAMRTGWNSISDSYITFIASPWMRQLYNNYNPGAFTINRKGPLAINSGSQIHHNYLWESVAYNTIVFPDPNETAPLGNRELWDKGNQRIFSAELYNSSSLTPGSIWDMGGVKRFLAADPSAGRNVDYIYADVTRTYNGPSVSDGYNTSKVKLFTRQFAYFRPDVAGQPDQIVIFDRTETTDTRFEKRWILHTARNPSVNGTATPNTPVRDGSGAGKTTYTGADLVTDSNTADGSSGKIFSRTLLPTSRKIVKVGGPNSSGQYYQSGANQSHEFEDSYGVNDIGEALPHEVAREQYEGTYRVEVIPANPSLKDNFLNVIETTDAGVVSMTPSALLQGSSMQGARVGNKIAVFNQNEALLSSGDFVIDNAGTYKTLISDLISGASYNVQYGPTTASRTASSAGTIYLDITTSSPDVRVAVSTGNLPPPAPIPTPTPTPTPTFVPSPSSTPTASSTPIPTSTPTPTATTTPLPTISPNLTPAPSPIPTGAIPTPTLSPLVTTPQVADSTRPTILLFSAYPSDNQVSINWHVVDGGGSRLDRIEINRTQTNSINCDIDITSGCRWSNVNTINAPSNAESWISFATNSPGTGTYLYGLHVIDKAGNRTIEAKPIRITINSVLPIQTPFVFPAQSPTSTPIPTTTPIRITCNFYRNLYIGSRGEDVRCLQKYLNSSGFIVAISGYGSINSETNYFGPLTRDAISRWQRGSNIYPTYGYFGPISRARYLESTR